MEQLFFMKNNGEFSGRARIKPRVRIKPRISSEIGGCGNKLTIKYVKQKIIELAEGYNCLSDNYIGADSYLKIKCNSGHIYKVTWSNFNSGYRCPICNIENKKSKNNHTWKGGITKLNIALYNTYAHQISWCEEVRRDPENNDWLQVRCTYLDCREWFIPGWDQTSKRIKAINGKSTGEHRLYCSEECKQNCPIFWQQKYPKGYKSHKESRSNQADWRKLVLERDEYRCVKCGSIEELIAHHIEGLNQNPLMSADIDLGITFCKKCDKEAHNQKGCKYQDLKKENICKQI